MEMRRRRALWYVHGDGLVVPRRHLSSYSTAYRDDVGGYHIPIFWKLRTEDFTALKLTQLRLDGSWAAVVQVEQATIDTISCLPT